MGFFGIGFPELALIFAVAVIVLGPERIPGVAIQLAKALRFLRGYATDATAQMRAELGDLTREYDAMRKELQEFRASVGKDLASVADDVTTATQEADRALKEAQPIVEPGGEPPPPAPGGAA